MADFKYISVRKRIKIKSSQGNAPKESPKAPEPKTEQLEQIEESKPSEASDQTVGE